MGAYTASDKRSVKSSSLEQPYLLLINKAHMGITLMFNWLVIS